MKSEIKSHSDEHNAVLGYTSKQRDTIQLSKNDQTEKSSGKQKSENEYQWLRLYNEEREGGVQGC
jgi:hypothetical protein